MVIKVGLLAYENCILTGLLAGLDFFRATNLVASEKIFDVRIVGLNSSPIKCAHNQKCDPETTIRAFEPDILILPGFWTSTTDEFQLPKLDDDLLQTMKNVKSTTQLYSYCTGVLLHLASNRLRRQSATATWWLAPILEKNYPAVNWDFSKLIVKAKDDFTASGANGYFSLYETLIVKYAGKSTLKEVRRYLLSPPLLQSNDPFFRIDGTTTKLGLKIKKIVEKTPARLLSVNGVSQQLGISSKTLGRHILSEGKVTAARYLRLVKFRQAAELLLSSSLSVRDVCDRLGFDDDSNFRRGFKSAVDLTPAEYVKKFRRPL